MSRDEDGDTQIREDIIARIDWYLLHGVGDTTAEAVEGNHIAEAARQEIKRLRIDASCERKSSWEREKELLDEIIAREADYQAERDARKRAEADTAQMRADLRVGLSAALAERAVALAEISVVRNETERWRLRELRLAEAARWLWDRREAEGLTDEIHDDPGCPQDDTCTCPTAVMLRVIPIARARK